MNTGRIEKIDTGRLEVLEAAQVDQQICSWLKGWGDGTDFDDLNVQEEAIQVDYSLPIQVEYTLNIQADLIFVPSPAGGRRANCARLGPQGAVAGAGRKKSCNIDSSRSCRLVSNYFQADWICRIFLIVIIVVMAMGGGSCRSYSYQHQKSSTS